MDALDALDAVGESNVQLVRQVGSDQWDGATPCTEWNVRSLVGHLIMGRHVYRGFLEGVPVAELRLILQQGGAVGDAPVAACESAVRSIRAAFAQPGALERTVHRAPVRLSCALTEEWPVFTGSAHTAEPSPCVAWHR